MASVNAETAAVMKAAGMKQTAEVVPLKKVNHA